MKNLKSEIKNQKIKLPITGPENTIICGKGGLSSNAVRCVYLTADANLFGFTLSNGYTFSSGDEDLEQGGGGAYFWYGGTSINSIVYYNKATNMPQTDNWRYWHGGTGIYTCTFPEFAGVGNITNEPCFISSIDNNWRLQSTSPSINSGTNALAAVPYDLDGNQRIIAGTNNGNVVGGTWTNLLTGETGNVPFSTFNFQLISTTVIIS